MRLLIAAGLLGSLSLPVSAAAPTPGLLMVLSRPTHPELTDAAFNAWYTNEHMHDMVNSGVTDLVVRYKNVNGSAKFPYLAIYRLPDAAKLKDPAALASVPATSKLLPGKDKGSTGGAYKDIMSSETRTYARTQTFEGQIAKVGRGKAIATVAMQPANGTDADYDDWYRRQHLDMLSMVQGYRRSTRYQKLDGSTPKYLVMHEFDTTTMPPDMKMVLGTEWSKKVMSGATSVSSEMWEYVSEFGKGAVGEKF